jgi:predicted MPP superfamily phosphohydrolase
MTNRRAFLATLGSAAACSFAAEQEGSRFRFAIIADTHIIDEFYRGPEGNPEDTESIFKTTERLRATRERINSLRPATDLTFLVGDYFHNYPSADIDFFFQHKTRVDAAKELTDGFAMPVHAGFGNHDYDVAHFSRENSHELFRRKFGLRPYYSIEHKGFKFIHVNNFLGATWEPKNARYDRSKGSLGEEQLNWLEAELEQRKPTFVFIHFPLIIVEPNERSGYGVHSILKKHRDTVQRVVSGHWHKWFEFGRSYGPPHLVIAATRYDPNAYLIVEADPKTAEHRLLNIDLVDWNTHFSSAWKG